MAHARGFAASPRERDNLQWEGEGWHRQLESSHTAALRSAGARYFFGCASRKSNTFRMFSGVRMNGTM